MGKRYVGSHVHQDDGSLCQWTNCWACVGVFLLDCATNGKKIVTPMQFRLRAGAEGCRTGGLGDIMRGLAAHGVTFTFLPDVPIATAKRRFASKTSTKVYAVETDFGDWPRRAKCDFGKDADVFHMVAILPGAQVKRGKRAVRTMDPNQCRRFKWVAIRDVIKAAVSYNNQHVEVRDTIDMLVVDTRRRSKP